MTELTPIWAEDPFLKFTLARERIADAYEIHGDKLVLTSSGGADAQIMLGLATEVNPRMPVIFVDTGYLFPETYKFMEDLRAHLKLNLHIYRPLRTAAMQEALDGRLWEGAKEQQEAYNLENKVEPMNRAIIELGATGWLSGRRREQSELRSSIPFEETTRGGIVKYNPIADWRTRDIYYYTKERGLPQHPLRDEGYISIGDVHSTIKGVQKTECGAHDESAAPRNDGFDYVI